MTGSPAAPPPNFRDVGGVALIDGGAVAAGILYRSDAWYAIDDIDDVLDSWPPSDVIDLRSPAEIEQATKAPWPSATRRHVIALLDSAAPALLSRPSADLYRDILADSGPLIADIARVVAHAAGPTLIHCTAGKDRTGVAVAMILLAVGATPSAVIADYCATEINLPAVFSRIVHLGIPEPAFDELPIPVRTAPAAAIAVVVDLHNSWPGGAGGWLRAQGLDTAELARLVAKLAPVERDTNAQVP